MESFHSQLGTTICILCTLPSRDSMVVYKSRKLQLLTFFNISTNISSFKRQTWKVGFNCLYFLVAVVRHKAAWIPFTIPRFYYSQCLRNSFRCLILESKGCNNHVFNVCFNNQEEKGNSVLSYLVSSVEKNYLVTIFLNQIKLVLCLMNKKQASCSVQFCDLQ